MYRLREDRGERISGVKPYRGSLLPPRHSPARRVMAVRRPCSECIPFFFSAASKQESCARLRRGVWPRPSKGGRRKAACRRALNSVACHRVTMSDLEQAVELLGVLEF